MELKWTKGRKRLADWDGQRRQINGEKKRMVIIFKFFCNVFTCLKEFLFTAQKRLINESQENREIQKVMNYVKERNDMRCERKISGGTKVFAKWL